MGERVAARNDREILTTRLSAREVRYFAACVAAQAGSDGAKGYIRGKACPDKLELAGFVVGKTPTARGLIWYDFVFAVRRRS